jgi:hypothetical protein
VKRRLRLLAVNAGIFLSLVATLEVTAYVLLHSGFRGSFARFHPAVASLRPTSRRFEIPSHPFPDLPVTAGPGTSSKELSLSGIDRSRYVPTGNIPYTVELEGRGGAMTPNPGFVGRSILKKSSGELIYDVEYSIDRFRRRSTQCPASPARNRHAIFLGCSYTFGEGTNDGETIPSRFCEDSSSYRSYNMGFHGTGPHDLLSGMLDPKEDYWAGIGETKGFALYSFMFDHLKRAVGSMRYVSTYGRNRAYFPETAEGPLRQRGTFETGRPLLTAAYKILGLSNLLDLFNVDLPTAYGEPEWRFFTRLVAGMKDRYLTRFPEGKFIVLLLPSTGNINPGRLTEKLAPYLEEAGIPYLDYTRYDLDRALGKSAHFPGDGHLTADANGFLARQVFTDLSGYFQNPR